MYQTQYTFYVCIYTIIRLHALHYRGGLAAGAGQVDKSEEGRRDLAAAGARTDSGVCTSAPGRQHRQQQYLGTPALYLVSDLNLTPLPDACTRTGLISKKC